MCCGVRHPWVHVLLNGDGADQDKKPLVLARLLTGISSQVELAVLFSVVCIQTETCQDRITVVATTEIFEGGTFCLNLVFRLEQREVFSDHNR